MLPNLTLSEYHIMMTFKIPKLCASIIVQIATAFISYMYANMFGRSPVHRFKAG